MQQELTSIERVVSESTSPATDSFSAIIPNNVAIPTTSPRNNTSMKSSRKDFIKDLILRKSGSIMKSNLDNGILGTSSPSPFALIECVVSATLAGDGSAPSVVDLGCGDARWLAEFASKSGGRCRCLGIEALPAQMQRARQLIAGRCDLAAAASIDLVMCDFFSVRWAVADLIIVYLSREGNEKILNKLEDECIPGTVVIAVGFQFLSRQIDCVYSSSASQLKAYKYIVNAARILSSSVSL